MISVWKVTDTDCPICKEMGEFDNELIVSMGYELTLIPFESAIHDPLLSNYVRGHLVDSNGAVDIPIYAVKVDGDFVGAVTGRNTKGELKRKLLQVTP